MILTYLEGIYSVKGNGENCAVVPKFNMARPPDFQGHSLSISDVIELYDDSGSDFYYVDKFGFQPINFGCGQNETMGMQM